MRRTRALGRAVCVGLLVSGPVLAAGTDSATGSLATIERQLDSIDRLAAASEQLPEDRGRYHFDYLRLHADVARIRTGLHDYLSPPRAQPRDSADLLGDYREPVEPAQAQP
ncbi:integrative conjugative element protein, RAQPRD family [Paraburkholderia aspalathi]|uniref:Integrative conjugative element protein, RAQPRD family n=2 Tax=Paraburkholderia aspalathi TaxID=1324617 RepID=A0A1I7ABA1_9BURK|nr:integrative conjugative element protein, RAQPRD family [Paraburkholderia aspalathi]